MSAAAWTLLAVAAILAVADWYAVATRTRALEYLAKPATLAVLVALALVLHPQRSGQRPWFVAALVLSLVGDVFLMLPADLFVPGLASFLLAHVGYTVGFDLYMGSTAAIVLSAVAVMVAGAALASRIVPRVLHGEDPALAGPVIAYMVVISVMVGSALAAGPALAATGAVFFYTSDTLIAWDRFVRSRPWLGVAVMVTYHVAQAALVASLAT
ncbi:MAG: lysoplasmalogenase [Actinobacteria bacterium]|nr:lysoplasmalogenase [Actinomycetota bacterium]